MGWDNTDYEYYLLNLSVIAFHLTCGLIRPITARLHITFIYHILDESMNSPTIRFHF